MTQKYDLVVLGGGTGGYVTAIRASQLGQSVAIVEKAHLGGTCLHKGCIPTKSLLHNANLINQIRTTNQLGITDMDVKLNYTNILKDKDKTVSQMYNGIKSLMKKNKIDVYHGHGRILGPSIFSPMAGTISIDTNDEESQILTSNNLVIATGSIPTELPFLKFNHDTIISSDDILTQDTLPESLLIVGGGVIGVEFASLLSDLGVSVTIVEGKDRIIPTESKDISKTLHDYLTDKGITIYTDVNLKEEDFNINKDVKITLSNQQYTFSQVLVAIGRTPNIEDIGLANTKIKIKNDTIITNQYYQTDESHIYAIGDILDTFQLAHVASKEGSIAAEHINDEDTLTLDYNTVPRCIYTGLEVASIGKTENELEESNIKFTISKTPLQAIGKAVIENGGIGFVKIIVDEDNSLLGASIVGANATELINELALAKFLDASIEEVYHTIHAHPSVSEGIMETAMQSDGRAIHF